MVSVCRPRHELSPGNGLSLPGGTQQKLPGSIPLEELLSLESSAQCFEAPLVPHSFLLVLPGLADRKSLPGRDNTAT